MSNYIKIAPIADIPEKTLTAYQLDEDEVIVYRLGQNYYVYPNQCTHQDLPLADGYVIDNAIICRRHGAKFDLYTGACLRMPAEDGLKQYKTILQDDILYIELNS